MSAEINGDNAGEFWAIVAANEPTALEQAERREKIANHPMVRLGLSWLRDNPYLEQAEYDEARERLVVTIAADFAAPLSEVDRAFHMCEQIMDYQGAERSHS